MLNRLTVISVLLLAGCGSSLGGTSPTAPSTQPPSVSSWTLTGHVTPALSGVSVNYAGIQAQTDAAGRFSVTHQQANPAPLTLTHPGILTRQVWLTGGQSREVTLDPIRLEPPFDATLWSQMVRDGLDSPDANKTLQRWTTAPRFYIQTTDTTGAAVDAETVNTVIAGIREAVPQFSLFQPAAIETGPSERPPTQGWIHVYFEGRQPEGQTICGRAQVATDPGWMRFWLDSCRVSGDRGRVGKWIVMHEVGHAMGFWHTGPGHVMHRIMSRASRTVTPSERHHAQLAYTRPPGNMAPDTDPIHILASTGSASPRHVISCGVF